MVILWIFQHHCSRASHSTFSSKAQNMLNYRLTSRCFMQMVVKQKGQTGSLHESEGGWPRGTVPVIFPPELSQGRTMHYGWLYCTWCYSEFYVAERICINVVKLKVIMDHWKRPIGLRLVWFSAFPLKSIFIYLHLLNWNELYFSFIALQVFHMCWKKTINQNLWGNKLVGTSATDLRSCYNEKHFKLYSRLIAFCLKTQH